MKRNLCWYKVCILPFKDGSLHAKPIGKRRIDGIHAIVVYKTAVVYAFVDRRRSFQAGPLGRRQKGCERMLTQFSGNEVQKCACVSLPAILGLDAIQARPEMGSRYFFASPLIAQRLALLSKMVGSASSSVVVVMGEAGAGKTTLINRFVSDESNRWQMRRIHFKTSSRNTGAAMCNLDNRPVFYSTDSPPSLIVDDAHQLSQCELRLVVKSAFAADGRRKLQSIVLFAEPSMRDRFAEIASALPPMTVVDKIFMAPLTEKQTAAYLEHRVHMAGILNRFPFSEDQISQIHKASKGLPGWINNHALLQLQRMHAGDDSGFLSLTRRLFPRLPRFRFF